MTRPLTDITGIGPAAAEHLQAAGFKSVEDVAKASPGALSAAQGFGPARSAKVIEAAQTISGNTVPSKAAKAISKPVKKPKIPNEAKKDDKKKEAKAKAKKLAAKAKAKVKAKKKAKAKKTSKKGKKGKKGNKK